MWVEYVHRHRTYLTQELTMIANYSVVKTPRKQGKNKILQFWCIKEFFPEYSLLIETITHLSVGREPNTDWE